MIIVEVSSAVGSASETSRTMFATQTNGTRALKNIRRHQKCNLYKLSFAGSYMPMPITFVVLKHTQLESVDLEVLRATIHVERDDE